MCDLSDEGQTARRRMKGKGDQSRMVVAPVVSVAPWDGDASCSKQAGTVTRPRSLRSGGTPIPTAAEASKETTGNVSVHIQVIEEKLKTEAEGKRKSNDDDEDQTGKEGGGRKKTKREYTSK